ncbi:histone-lysine N-methyltransferase SETMAR [Trichonephila clavipes]|nr:histone-lysine N-methyltransferase SETMAR [Trichonephila clavipes]
MIDLITTYYGNAIRQNKTCLSDMRKAVWAVYFHTFKRRRTIAQFLSRRSNSWCKYQNQVVEGSVETFRHSNKLPVAVMDAIKPVFNDLSKPKLLQKCLGAAETVNGVYDADIVTANYVQLWFRRFRSDIFDAKDAPRTGRHVVENVNKIKKIIEDDWHVSSHIIAQELKIDHKTVLKYLCKVGFKKKLDVWVPHQLTPKNMMD